VHGIASGMAGKRIGSTPKSKQTTTFKTEDGKIKSVDDIPSLMGILQGAGLKFGVRNTP